jgi:hypothetical protein
MALKASGNVHPLVVTMCYLAQGLQPHGIEHRDHARAGRRSTRATGRHLVDTLAKSDVNESSPSTLTGTRADDSAGASVGRTSVTDYASVTWLSSSPRSGCRIGKRLYRFVGWGSVSEKVSQVDVWDQPRLKLYRGYRNLSIKSGAELGDYLAVHEVKRDLVSRE